jgi:hypothetical protein
MAEAVTGNPFLDGLLERAPASVSTPRRGQNYNYPLRRYLLPDGRVEMLQGDPHNRAYYEDKGYKLLSDIPGRDGGPSEVERYVQVEYPKILAEQREKASIINAIRRAGERDRNLNFEDDFDQLSLDEMRDELKRIQEDYGKPIRISKSRAAERADRARDAMLQGVETTEQTSMEALEQRRTQRPPRQGGAP